MKPHDESSNNMKKNERLNISPENDPILYVEEWVHEAVDNIPEDLASEHDHYLYSLPKKKNNYIISSTDY
ncbi:MAG: hypothetical protein ABRQ38_15765 [Candidatus Eremiobacterota bacterium]